MIMESSKIEESIVNFLVDDLFVDVPKEKIDPEVSLQHDIGVDSLGFVELMAFLEDQFEIKIEGEEFKPENFRSVRQVRMLIEKKLNLVANSA